MIPQKGILAWSFTDWILGVVLDEITYRSVFAIFNIDLTF